MKLYLLSAVLLLAPLVFADLPSPAVKILFDGDPHGHVLGEGFNAHEIHYRDDGDRLIFEMRTNTTKLVVEYMILDQKARRKSFVVENFPYASDFDSDKPNREFCREKSSENLRDLIQDCRYQIRLRNFTEEERKRMMKFQNEQNGRMHYKMIYDKSRIQTQSIDVPAFFMVNYLDEQARTILLFSDDKKGERSMVLLKNEHLSDRSFVIESQSSGDCTKVDPSVPKPSLCKGNVKIRPLTESDKPY